MGTAPFCPFGTALLTWLPCEKYRAKFPNVTTFGKFLYKFEGRDRIEVVKEMGARLMAGQQTLNLYVEVRLLCAQQDPRQCPGFFFMLCFCFPGRYSHWPGGGCIHNGGDADVLRHLGHEAVSGGDGGTYDIFEPPYC